MGTGTQMSLCPQAAALLTGQLLAASPAALSCGVSRGTRAVCVQGRTSQLWGARSPGELVPGVSRGSRHLHLRTRGPRGSPDSPRPRAVAISPVGTAWDGLGVFGCRPLSLPLQHGCQHVPFRPGPPRPAPPGWDGDPSPPCPLTSCLLVSRAGRDPEQNEEALEEFEDVARARGFSPEETVIPTQDGRRGPGLALPGPCNGSGNRATPGGSSLSFLGSRETPADTGPGAS